MNPVESGTGRDLVPPTPTDGQNEKERPLAVEHGAHRGRGQGYVLDGSTDYVA